MTRQRNPVTGAKPIVMQCWQLPETPALIKHRLPVKGSCLWHFEQSAASRGKLTRSQTTLQEHSKPVLHNSEEDKVCMLERSGVGFEYLIESLSPQFASTNSYARLDQMIAATGGSLSGFRNKISRSFLMVFNNPRICLTGQQQS